MSNWVEDEFPGWPGRDHFQVEWGDLWGNLAWLEKEIAVQAERERKAIGDLTCNCCGCKPGSAAMIYPVPKIPLPGEESEPALVWCPRCLWYTLWCKYIGFIPEDAA